MSDSLIIVLIAMSFGIAVLLFAFSLGSLKNEVPGEDRAYLDPLPPMLRMIWPLVRFLEYHVGKYLPSSVLESSSKKLQLTGVSFLMGAEQFFALRFLSMLIAFALTYFSLTVL